MYDDHDDDSEGMRVRNDCFLALSKGFEKVRRPNARKIDAWLAEELHVAVEQLTLNKDDSDSPNKKLFFHPYNMSRLKSLEPNIRYRVTRERLQLDRIPWETARKDSTGAADFLRVS
jgi:hypothetical protein